MNIKFVVIMLLLSAACSSIKPVELAPEQLQQKILTGNIIQEGDMVKLVTAGGEHHEFKVLAITETEISGKDKSIAINEIVALETREFSGGKTSLLVGGTLLWLYLILISIPAIVVL